MSIPTREEFDKLISEYGRAVQWQDVEGEGRRVAEAYDAALARIAELERHREGLHCNAIEAMLPTIPKVPEMIGLESSSLFPEEK